MIKEEKRAKSMIPNLKSQLHNDLFQIHIKIHKFVLVQISSLNRGILGQQEQQLKYFEPDTNNFQFVLSFIKSSMIVNNSDRNLSLLKILLDCMSLIRSSLLGLVLSS